MTISDQSIHRVLLTKRDFALSQVFSEASLSSISILPVHIEKYVWRLFWRSFVRIQISFTQKMLWIIHVCHRHLSCQFHEIACHFLSSNLFLQWLMIKQSPIENLWFKVFHRETNTVINFLNLTTENHIYCWFIWAMILITMKNTMNILEVTLRRDFKTT